MNKFNLLISLIFICLASSTSSAETLEATAKKMVAEACKGNSEQFFSYFDEPAIISSLTDQMIEIVKQKDPSLTKDDEYSYLLTEDHYKPLIIETWKVFEDSIEQIDPDDECGLRLGPVNTSTNKAILLSGYDSKLPLIFTRSGKNWKVTSIPLTEFIFSDDKQTSKSDSPATSTISDNNNYDFRKTRWGMTIEQVKKNEQAKFVGGIDQTLLYDDDIAGLPVTLVYAFSDNKLSRAGYKIEKTYNDYDQYLKDYEVLKNAFTKKYGEPYASGADWEIDTYKNNPEKYGVALSQGHFSYISVWITKTTDITLGLYKKDGEIKFGVYYMPISKDDPNKEYKIGEQEIEDKL